MSSNKEKNVYFGKINLGIFYCDKTTYILGRYLLRYVQNITFNFQIAENIIMY